MEKCKVKATGDWMFASIFILIISLIGFVISINNLLTNPPPYNKDIVFFILGIGMGIYLMRIYLLNYLIVYESKIIISSLTTKKELSINEITNINYEIIVGAKLPYRTKLIITSNNTKDEIILYLNKKQLDIAIDLINSSIRNN